MKTTRILALYSRKQMRRTPLKTVMLMAVIGVVCAFFCISLNLRQTAQDNIQLLKEEFDVVAIPTFMGSVNRQGELVLDTKDSGYQGYLETQAHDFDLSVIEQANGVKDVLVHKQFGAYLKSEENLVPGYAQERNTGDVVIFTYNGEEPLVLEENDYLDADVSILWSAREYHELPSYRSTIKVRNDVSIRPVEEQWSAYIAQNGLDDMWLDNTSGKKNGGFVLQPGQTYIALAEWSLVTRLYNGIYKKGYDRLNWLEIGIGDSYSKQFLFYEDGGFYTTSDKGEYEVAFPCILPYTEDFWETEAGAYYQNAAEVCKINGSALPVVTTGDLSLYLPFYNEKTYLVSGRSFSEEDYANGNKVCIVSLFLAMQNGWGIGHKIDMSFFEALYGYNVRSVEVDTLYEPFVEHYDEATGEYSLEMKNLFFDGGEYEIIGIYGGNVTRGGFTDDIQYTKEEGIDRRVIFVPEKSVQNQPEVPLSQYNTTILLDDEQTMYFMSDMEASGLLEQRKGEYQLKLDIYDQGYGAIKQSLRQLDTVSRLTLYLACAAAVVVIVLLAVLTVLQNRRQIATLRSLGVRKRQIPGAVLSGVLLVCLIGAIAGGMLGHTLSDRVAEYILDTAQMDLADTSFSVMLAKEDVEEEDHYAIAIQSRPEVAVFAGVVVMTALTALCCFLALWEARKSPMLTLGAKE